MYFSSFGGGKASISVAKLNGAYRAEILSTGMIKPNELINKVLVLGAMVFDATFNNISVISWRSVLLVEETRVSSASH